MNGVDIAFYIFVAVWFSFRLYMIVAACVVVVLTRSTRSQVSESDKLDPDDNEATPINTAFGNLFRQLFEVLVAMLLIFAMNDWIVENFASDASIESSDTNSFFILSAAITIWFLILAVLFAIKFVFHVLYFGLVRKNVGDAEGGIWLGAYFFAENNPPPDHMQVQQIEVCTARDQLIHIDRITTFAIVLPVILIIVSVIF